MNNLTLVAFYGQKTDTLLNLIEFCLHSVCKSALAEYFIPYDLNQVHATIIGMESFKDSHRIINANYYQQTGKKVGIESESFPTIIDDAFPVSVRFGGFPDTYKGFSSFEKTPYERTFLISKTTWKVILIGWPFQQESSQVKNTLSELRSDFENKCRIAHKYRDDNDLYFVLGNLCPPKETEKNIFDQQIAKTEKDIRDQLSNKPIEIILGKENLGFISYSSPDLNVSSSSAFPLEPYYQNIDRLIESLY